MRLYRIIKELPHNRRPTNATAKAARLILPATICLRDNTPQTEKWNFTNLNNKNYGCY